MATRAAAASSDSSAGPSSLAELTAKFKKQGEERKRRLASQETPHATDAYLEQPKKRRTATAPAS